MKFFLAILILIVFLFFNNACLLSNQKGCSTKVKNGDILSIGLDKTAIIKNIWKDISLKDWHIKIKVLAIGKENVKLLINSSTFLKKDFCEAKSVKIGETITIIQAEEVITKVKLDKIFTDRVSLSLEILSEPPAPKLSGSFDIELTE